MQLIYLVTGTGRSGTMYMAKLLTDLGYPCGHESIFTTKGVESAINFLNNPDTIEMSALSIILKEKWLNDKNIVADSSYMAAPFLHHQILQDTKIIHVIRHPILVINSFIQAIKYFQNSFPSNEWEQFIYKHMPELGETMDCYTRAALYYIRWNNFISKNFHFRYFLGEDTSQLFSYMNACCSNKIICRDKIVNKLISVQDFSDHVPDSIIKKELIDLCNQYGFNYKIRSSNILMI